MSLNILYEDNHLLAVNKPAGLLVQGDRTGDETLLDQARAYIKEKYQKPGNVFIGLVHRLDRPVSGVVVLARTSKGASRLSAQFRNKQVEKIYWALVEGQVEAQGDLKHNLVRSGQFSRIGDREEGQWATLSYKRLGGDQKTSWVEIQLGTGRHHQIRVQFAHQGHPVLGDKRYEASRSFPNRSLALHARSLTITHPTREERLTFTADLPDYWPDWAGKGV